MSQKIREKATTKISLPQEGIASFIRKTYEILEEGKYPDIISWNDDGNFLVIKDAEEFSQKVLPVHFKHGNFTSFVRQLNMYNFHKKRSMNAEHIYYHELFKRGKVDLLRHIKRKNSEPTTSTGSTMLGFELFQVQSGTNYQISQENLMLKQMNKEAFAKINTLEAKVNDLCHENEVLIKRISDKQEKEEILQSAFSKYFQSSQPGKLTTSQSSKIEPLERAKMNIIEGVAYPTSYDKPLQPLCMTNNTGLVVCSVITRETSLPSDSASNVDSYLNFNGETQFIEATAYQPTQTTQNFSQGSDICVHSAAFSSEDTTSLLGKRNIQQYKNPTYEEAYFPYEETAKLQCFNPAEETEEPKLNLMDFNTALFVGGKQDERC
jgi:hypothetical protein